MNPLFEELDYRPTPIGALSLRRRREPAMGVDVLEIKLGDAFLMSSHFTASEIALADLGLAAVAGRGADEGLDVVVGGLGLGYTAEAVLAHESVGSLLVVEMLAPVIEWHREGLLPIGETLLGDRRCRLAEGDFFALAASDQGFDAETPRRRFHAILVDIDHSPEALLDARSEGFYTPDGLRALEAHLHPGGVFGLWSNEPPDPGFTERLGAVFAAARAEPVRFHNPLQDREMVQTVYLGGKEGDAA